MDVYLAIITTVLVITQVIRVWQNRKQLKRQESLVQKELERLGVVTQEELETQKQFYRLGLECFKLFQAAFYKKATEAIMNEGNDANESD